MQVGVFVGGGREIRAKHGKSRKERLYIRV